MALFDARSGTFWPEKHRFFAGAPQNVKIFDSAQSSLNNLNFLKTLIILKTLITLKTLKTLIILNTLKTLKTLIILNNLNTLITLKTPIILKTLIIQIIQKIPPLPLLPGSPLGEKGDFFLFSDQIMLVYYRIMYYLCLRNN